MSLLPIERRYVLDSYRDIAQPFSASRAYLWEGVKGFLSRIPKGSLVLEVGAGNGKNLALCKRNDICLTGCDLTTAFCEITQSRGFECPIANIVHLPYRSDSVDCILCIAVIHHLSTEERRIRAIQELVRVAKSGAQIFIQVWAMEQPKRSRNKFTKADNLVPWNDPTHTMTRQRYYHVFQCGELLELIRKAEVSVDITSSYYEVGNWVVELDVL